MRIINNDTISDVTPEIIAELFCHLDQAGQARFFNHVDSIASTWDAPFEMQLQAITDDDGLTLAGRRVMQAIGDYSHWGGIIRSEGGREMTNIQKIRDALVGGIDLAKSAGWTRHQQDEIAEAEEALRLFDGMMDKGSVAAPKLPQSVEEFIDDYARTPATINPASEVIFADDLRSWMTGHVRVPVELLYEIQQSIGTVDERSPQQVAGMFRAISVQIESMLNASKGE